MTTPDIIGTLSTLRSMHVLRQWDENAARSWGEVIEALEESGKLVETSMFIESGPLLAHWRKEADQYLRQVEETRAAGTPWQGMLAMATALRQCAKELEQAVK